MLHPYSIVFRAMWEDDRPHPTVASPDEIPQRRQVRMVRRRRLRLRRLEPPKGAAQTS